MVLRTLKRLVPDQHPLRLAWHKARAFVAAVRYGFPARKLTVIGVTGTDGKTTTVGMIAHVLHENGIAVGALSTAFFRVKDAVEWNATQKTSPSPFVIQAFLRRLVREGCTHAVLEYSSHGLVQGRMNHTWPLAAGITNVSEEHLDYHGNMEEYIRAKGLLFRMLRTKGGTKVLNAADPACHAYRAIPTDWTVLYATDRAPPSPVNDHEYAIWATDTVSTPEGVEANVHVDDKSDPARLKLRIAGAFNVDNALCAIGCAHLCTPGDCVQSLSTFPGIPGRMERIDEGQPFHVFVDFTVTPKSYRHTLSTLRASLPEGKRLLVLTGSCGDRMREKRPIIGRIVSEHADVMAVADEDPYTEDPARIIDEVWAGIDQAATEAHRIPDRREAMQFLLKAARPGDIVVFCGKGSDTTMWTKEGQIPWNERAIARELLHELQPNAAA